MAIVNPLSAELARLCDAFDRIGGAEVEPVTAAIHAASDQPLRLAVVGRVKAGKSTLVNALLGRRVAPTSEAECTRIVTHYRHGSPERGEVTLRDGTVLPFNLHRGALPDDLPWPTDEISHAVVYLDESPLLDFTLVDTPGLATTTRDNEAATRNAILAEDGSRQADALVYVFRDSAFADDFEFLRDFVAAAGESTTRPASVIAVLSHADDFGDGAWATVDSLVSAHQFATELASRRSEILGVVVPLGGLLAEAALTGLVTEDLSRSLASLREVDELTLKYRAHSSGDVANEISATIGDYGLRFGRDAAAHGARALIDWLVTASGVSALQQELRARYVGRYPQLKAARAIKDLRSLARSSSHKMELERLLADTEQSPGLHPLRELRAWELMRARHPDHPVVGELDHQLAARDDWMRLGIPRDSDPASTRMRARALESEARSAGTLAIDDTTALAHLTLARTYSLVAQRHADQEA